MSHEGDFDFARFNAETVNLQLLVCSTQISQHPIGIAANQVARGVPTTRQGRDVVTETVCCQFCLAQIAVSQTVTAQQQFAFGILGDLACFRIAQGDLDVRQGLSNWRDGGPLSLLAGQLKRCDDMTFSGAVVVVQNRLRQVAEQLSNGWSDLQLFARTDHVLQDQGLLVGSATRLAVRLGQHLQSHIGQIQAGPAMGDQGLTQQVRVAAV